MNTEEKEVNPADVAMIAELEQKVEERIVGILQKQSYFIKELVYANIASHLVSDPNFIANMGRKIAEREARNHSF